MVPAPMCLVHSAHVLAHADAKAQPQQLQAMAGLRSQLKTPLPRTQVGVRQRTSLQTLLPAVTRTPTKMSRSTGPPRNCSREACAAGAAGAAGVVGAARAAKLCWTLHQTLTIPDTRVLA